MKATAAPEPLFRDIPFEDLERALRRGEGLEAWGDVLEQIVARVAAATRRRFPGAPFWEDAVQSACRTFLRRARAGAFELSGPQALIGLLVTIAGRKALEQGRAARREPVAVADLDALPAEEPPPPEGHDLLLREAMADQLRSMLARVEESLKEGPHRQILPYWFAKEYGGEKVSREDIARAVGRSVPTVDRVFREIRQKWQPLVEEGRRAIQELARATR
jgi:DNA-directed RNA polymerase specialized sigma24 family protein